MSELALQYDDLEKQTHASRLGLWIFIASELMIFAGLFATYAALRATYPAAFRAATERSALWLGSANTAILLTSSLVVALGVHACREGHARRTSRLLLLAAAMGVAFLAVKGTEYGKHIREGLVPGGSSLPRGEQVFFTLYYIMTGLHALHVLAGIAILLWLALRARLGRYGKADHEHVALELGGIYWHFVDLVWLYLWPLFYLLR